MSSKMLESKVGYSTRKICKDLIDLIGHSSQPDEIYGRFLCMQDSSSSNYSSNRNFVMMLVILFLMEFARGMYILSYINFYLQ